jgi:signal transduction histidine kinase
MKERHDIYLIFKEAINNIAKHSKAQIAQVKIFLVNNKFAMKINDDGKGFDMNTSFINNGLKNMKERAQIHKWNLQLQSQNNCGTTILLNT